MTTKHFGRIVRDKRERKRLTMEHTAELAGISEVALSAIELGGSNPKLSSILGIAAALDLDLGDLNSCKPEENKETILKYERNPL